MDRNSALTICFGNLKGSRSKDLLETARALKFLKDLPEYGSNQKVADQVGVSGEIVRQFISLLDLPPSVLEHIGESRLGLEQGRRLRQLYRDRPSIVDPAAEAMLSMTAMEARDFADYLRRNPASTVEDAIVAVETAKATIVTSHLVGALLTESEFNKLSLLAKKRKLDQNQLATNIIRQWIESNDD